MAKILNKEAPPFPFTKPNQDTYLASAEDLGYGNGSVKDALDNAVGKTDGISKESTQSEEQAVVFETDGGTQVGKIDANGADFTNLKRGGQQVARMSDLPTKDTSIGENPSTTNVPTTKAVKDYVDANRGEDYPIETETTQSEEVAIIYETDGGVQVGKIDATGADFANLKRGGQQVARMSDLPTKDTSIGENPSTTNVPTTKAVKDYVDEHGGGTGDLPIDSDTTTDEDDLIVFGCDDYNPSSPDMSKVSMIIDNGGIKVKKITKLDGSEISTPSSSESRIKQEGITNYQRPIFDINLFGVYGQSLSTGQQTCPELSRENYRGNLMIGLYEWVSNQATVSSSATFAPLVARSIDSSGQQYIPSGTGDQTNGETSCVNACNAAKKLLDDYILQVVDRKFLDASFGVGGISIELLSKGCPNNSGVRYAALERAVDIIKSAADTANKSVGCTAIVWMQGEWNEASHEDMGWYDQEASTHDKDDYKAYLIGGTASNGAVVNGMVNDLISTFKTKFEQSENPIVLGSQMGTSFIRFKELPIMMAQLEASQQSDKYLICTPCYRVTDRGGHLDSNGERWLGEFYAKVWYKKVILGQDWKPLQPKKIKKGNNIIEIDFHVPEPPLVFDTNQVRPKNNYGFQIFDGGVAKTISKVEISGNKVLLTASSYFVGDVEVTYAGLNMNYGNLRDSDNWKSFEVYKDLDTIVENPSGVSYRPSFEPKDENGNVIYNKPYPCQNFCVQFYYKLLANQNELTINI